MPRPIPDLFPSPFCAPSDKALYGRPVTRPASGGSPSQSPHWPRARYMHNVGRRFMPESARVGHDTVFTKTLHAASDEKGRSGADASVITVKGAQQSISLLSVLPGISMHFKLEV